MLPAPFGRGPSLRQCYLLPSAEVPLSGSATCSLRPRSLPEPVSPAPFGRGPSLRQCHLLPSVEVPPFGRGPSLRQCRPCVTDFGAVVMLVMVAPGRHSLLSYVRVTHAWRVHVAPVSHGGSAVYSAQSPLLQTPAEDSSALRDRVAELAWQVSVCTSPACSLLPVQEGARRQVAVSRAVGDHQYGHGRLAVWWLGMG